MCPPCRAHGTTSWLGVGVDPNPGWVIGVYPRLTLLQPWLGPGVHPLTLTVTLTLTQARWDQLLDLDGDQSREIGRDQSREIRRDQRREIRQDAQRLDLDRAKHREMQVRDLDGARTEVRDLDGARTEGLDLDGARTDGEASRARRAQYLRVPVEVR